MRQGHSWLYHQLFDDWKRFEVIYIAILLIL